MTSRDLQPFFAPQALDLLVIDMPAFDLQEGGDLAIPVSAILLGQAYECEPEGIFILGPSPEGIALGTAGLIQYLAGATLIAAQALANMDDRIAYLFRAYPCILKNPGLPSEYSFPVQGPTRSCVSAGSLSPDPCNA